jgi:ribA/ribD-fused uncharacterized protein
MRNVRDLLSCSKPLKYLAFWGHTPKVKGQAGPHMLSQWWPSPFEVEGVTYATAEHYMMAEKARLFGDEELRQQILIAPHPNAAKGLGRRVMGYDQDVWETCRYSIVVSGNLAKFSSDPGLTDYLLSTGERVLVEASPLDRVWGIGLTADDPRVTQPEHWQGLNLLGFALMEVRQQLRQS